MNSLSYAALLKALLLLHSIIALRVTAQPPGQKWNEAADGLVDRELRTPRVESGTRTRTSSSPARSLLEESFQFGGQCTFNPVVEQVAGEGESEPGSELRPLPVELWRHCVASAGAVPVEHSDATAVSADTVEHCFDRCAAEPLCTAFTAVPHYAQNSVQYCKLWMACDPVNTLASSVSAPFFVNAYALSGECMRKHKAAVQSHRESHAALVATLEEQISQVARLRGDDDTEALFEDGRFEALVAELATAAGLLYENSYAKVAAPVQQALEKVRLKREFLNHKAKKKVDELCAELVGFRARFEKHCSEYQAKRIVALMSKQMIQTNRFQPDEIADAARMAFELGGGGASKAAAVASGAFADAVEYITLHRNSSDAHPEWCVDKELPVHARQQTCATLGKLSCRFEVVRKACCMCDGGGLPMGEAYNFKAIRNKTLVFIGGAHFSGTSLLESIFDQSIMSSGFHETHVPEDEGQHLQDVFPRATETGGTKFGCHDEAYLDEQSPLISPENAHRLWNSWSRWWDPNKSVYLEKSPPNAAKFPFLQEMFKEAHKTVFVAILRHPIAILRKRFFGFGGKMRQYRTKEKLRRSLEDRLGCWFRLYRELQTSVTRLKNIAVIRYEDFMNNFDETLLFLENLAGIEHLSIKNVSSGSILRRDDTGLPGANSFAMSASNLRGHDHPTHSGATMSIDETPISAKCHTLYHVGSQCGVLAREQCEAEGCCYDSSSPRNPCFPSWVSPKQWLARHPNTKLSHTDKTFHSLPAFQLLHMPMVHCSARHMLKSIDAIDDSDCYYSCLMERECTAFSLFPSQTPDEAGPRGTCELYRQCLIEAGSVTVQIWLEINEGASKKKGTSDNGHHSRQQMRHVSSNDNALKRFASKFQLDANQSLKTNRLHNDAELERWWRRSLWLNPSASRLSQPPLPHRFSAEESDAIGFGTKPPAQPAPSNPTHRRRLFFHGNKNDLVVDKSMAYKWIKDMKALLQLRASTVNVPEANWQFLTPAQKLSSLFSDEFIAKYDALLAPYGYSMSQPERLTSPTVFRGLGPTPTAVDINWQQFLE